MVFSIHFREITFKELESKKDLLKISTANKREEIQMKLKLIKETREKIEEMIVMSKHRFLIYFILEVMLNGGSFNV